MQHEERKFHQDRKFFIIVYHSVQRKIEKAQNTEVMKFNSKQLIHYLKVEIAALEWMI